MVALVFLAAGAIGVWTLTNGQRDRERDVAKDASTEAEKMDAINATDAAQTAIGAPDWTFPEPYYEAAIVTSLSEKELSPYLAPATLAAALKPGHCGEPAACEAVRAFVADPAHTKTEIMTAERWTLPPPDRIATASPELSESERVRVQTLRHVLVVRIGSGEVDGGTPAATKRASSPDNLVARAGFAVAAALSEATNGFVYDEVRQRIETPVVAQRKCVTAKLGTPLTPADQIVLQALPVSEAKEGSFRLTSHGMKRFGRPDLEIVCTEKQLVMAAHVLNALAISVVQAATPERQVGLQLQLPSTATTRKMALVLGRAPIAEAQPINVVLRVSPTKGDLDDAPASAGGVAGGWTDASTDGEKKEASAAIDRAVKKGVLQGLLVRADFASDAGVEAMWIELTGCEGGFCTGILRSHPTMATHVRYDESVRVPLASIDKVLGAPTD